MSLKMECHSKWIVTENNILQKKNVTQIEFHLKKCHSKLNVNQNGISPKIECHSKLNVTHNGMSFKVESHSK